MVNNPNEPLPLVDDSFSFQAFAEKHGLRESKPIDLTAIKPNADEVFKETKALTVVGIDALLYPSVTDPKKRRAIAQGILEFTIEMLEAKNHLTNHKEP